MACEFSNLCVPTELTVVVLGPPPRGLVDALWRSGLRPVRGQTGGSVWALPAGEVLR